MDLVIRYGVPIVLGLWIGWLLTRNKRALIKGQSKHLIDQETFKQNMRKGQLIDMRKKSRFEEGRIKGARNFSVSFLTSKRQSQVRKDQAVFLYCDNGKRSYKAARKLLAKGYYTVYVLEGGFKSFHK